MMRPFGTVRDNREPIGWLPSGYRDSCPLSSVKGVSAPISSEGVYHAARHSVRSDLRYESALAARGADGSPNYRVQGVAQNPTLVHMPVVGSQVPQWNLGKSEQGTNTSPAGQ